MNEPIWKKDLSIPEGTSVRFTVVIPTLNAAKRIGWTLQSLENQTYPDIEIVIIDAGSTDATLEVVQRSSCKQVRIYRVAKYNLFDMINRGISLATGHYLGILTPGGSYISRETIQHVCSLAHQKGQPELIYSGTLLRELTDEPQTLLHSFSAENLRHGRAPTSYQACWFKTEMLRKLGKLDSSYRVQGALDLFCRLSKRKELKVAFTERILVDRDRRDVAPATLLVRAWETIVIIRRHYGIRAMLGWCTRQNPWRLIRWWWRSKRPHLFS